MAVHGHKWKGTGSANIEIMPSVTDQLVRYAKSPECKWDVMARQTGEPTLTPGAEMTVAGKTGIASDASKELLPGTTMDGVGDVWELTATLALDTATI